jgi:Lar family restriction alleviation protein
MSTEQINIHPELLPCPFCGSHKLSLDNLTDVDDYSIECEDCQIQQIANYTLNEAIRRWNTRVPPLPAIRLKKRRHGGSTILAKNTARNA